LAAIQDLSRFLLLSHRPSTHRYWEVDVARGIAILLMVFYHFVFDLTFFGYYGVNVFSGAWRIFGRIPAVLFLLLVGISLALAENRALARGTQVSARSYVSRGLKIFGWGMVITVASWLYIGQPVILFGILHLIGTATILTIPFLRHRRPAFWLFLSLIIFVAGLRLNANPVESPWLMFLGLVPAHLYQLDYFPLLPWFGVVLAGVALGQILFPEGRRRFELPEWGRKLGLDQLAWMGQRSLLIYLLHQPVLFSLLYLLYVARPGGS
jgi:uncharacterized membrane protein